MKTFLTFLICVAACGCASAMPPAHKPFMICCTLSADASNPVTGANFYKAHPQDTAWTPEGSITGTNGQTVMVPYDASYELHTADATNSVTGGTSDYCPILTNAVPVAPGNPRIK